MSYTDDIKESIGAAIKEREAAEEIDERLQESGHFIKDRITDYVISKQYNPELLMAMHDQLDSIHKIRNGLNITRYYTKKWRALVEPAIDTCLELGFSCTEDSSEIDRLSDNDTMLYISKEWDFYTALNNFATEQLGETECVHLKLLYHRLKEISEEIKTKYLFLGGKWAISL